MVRYTNPCSLQEHKARPLNVIIGSEAIPTLVLALFDEKYERPVATWQQAREILGLQDV